MSTYKNFISLFSNSHGKRKTKARRSTKRRSTKQRKNGNGKKTRRVRRMRGG